MIVVRGIEWRRCVWPPRSTRPTVAPRMFGESPAARFGCREHHSQCFPNFWRFSILSILTPTISTASYGSKVFVPAQTPTFYKCSWSHLPKRRTGASCPGDLGWWVSCRFISLAKQVPLTLTLKILPRGSRVKGRGHKKAERDCLGI